MAIDTKSLTQLITEFRALQSKDAVSPDSLGYILQRIADLLTTAGTSETVTKIQTLLDGFKTAGYALTSIAQGQSDRNHVYANIGKVSLADGSTSSTLGIFIQQATTERAGAMRAQQVTDLNAAKKGVTELQSKVAELAQLLSELQGGGAVVATAQRAHISCEIVDGQLFINGATQLIDKGYVPYLFRWTRKRNQFHHKQKYLKPGDEDKRYCRVSKGWHCFGSRFAIRLDRRQILFATGSHSEFNLPNRSYSADPTNLVQGIKVLDQIGWGRSVISLKDRFGKYRMLRLRFAIGFAVPLLHGHKSMKPSYMLSNLAEFSLVFNPKTMVWSLSK